MIHMPYSALRWQKFQFSTCETVIHFPPAHKLSRNIHDWFLRLTNNDSSKLNQTGLQVYIHNIFVSYAKFQVSVCWNNVLLLNNEHDTIFLFLLSFPFFPFFYVSQRTHQQKKGFLLLFAGNYWNKSHHFNHHNFKQGFTQKYSHIIMSHLLRRWNAFTAINFIICLFTHWYIL